MTVLFDNRYEGEFDDEFFSMVEKVALLSLQYEDFDTDCEISVSFVDNEEIRDINKRFRNIDSATDVLSFPQLTFEEDEIAEVNENDEIINQNNISRFQWLLRQECRTVPLFDGYCIRYIQQLGLH